MKLEEAEVAAAERPLSMPGAPSHGRPGERAAGGGRSVEVAPGGDPLIAVAILIAWPDLLGKGVAWSVAPFGYSLKTLSRLRRDGRQRGDYDDDDGQAPAERPTMGAR